MLVILLIAEGDMPRRGAVPEFVPDDRIAVLAFEPSDLRHPVGRGLALQYVYDRWWSYKFDERHPYAAEKYHVELFPTYIVQRDGVELWRTHDPAALAGGLGWAP